MNWLLLALAIVAEVTATTALKAADGFTRLAPSMIAITGYAIAFWLLSLTLRTVPIGIAYAIWSGAGIALIALIGWYAYGQRLDPAALLGMALIVAGIVVLSAVSGASEPLR
ncbi:MAG TPA: multidrug efflux SMR transporter [Burkholderiaceae bacterium]|jgi:small multidrug resistance pump|nr:multidrug efflux SMR transporter [Burkholderiaceae bacterium]